MEIACRLPNIVATWIVPDLNNSLTVALRRPKVIDQSGHDLVKEEEDNTSPAKRHRNLWCQQERRMSIHYPIQEDDHTVYT